jgi:hypothetical protein
MDSALSWSSSRSTNKGDVNVMKRAMGVAQHHDAVSGTEKQAVVHTVGIHIIRADFTRAWSNVRKRRRRFIS